MPQTKPTVFQRLGLLLGNGQPTAQTYDEKTNKYNISSDTVIFKTRDKEEYENEKMALHQQHLLARQWVRAQYDVANKSLAGLTDVKIMYRDADLMDLFPEIGAALDIMAEESCFTPNNGFMVNVSSKSERIKAILQDLLYNKLSIHMMLPMVCRSTCKYGNTFMLLNIDRESGVVGWRQLPVYEMERYENGMDNPYAQAFAPKKNIDIDADDSIKFVWVGQNEFIPYQNWQIAHFRLLYDSLYMPYGVSALNKARRHFRMLSMMEDMMLIYRMDRSMERRVFKINVGAIDEADVPAYVQQIADNFKRTPIVDPLTGQLDLRKNIMPVWRKTPIPLLDGRIITIEDLAKEYENGRENFVYSIQDETMQVVPGKVMWCGKNYEAKKMVKVTLDDGGYIVLAPEHEFIMRDGSKKRADEVCIGDSVMPFYTQCDTKSVKYMERYEKTYNPNSGKYEFTHRLIANEVDKPLCEYKVLNTVHHIDYNKYNNNPSNLLWCNFNDHKKMHSQVSKNTWSDPLKRERIIKKLSSSRLEYYKENVFSDEIKNKISNTLKTKYANGEMEHVRKISSENIRKYHSSEACSKNTSRANILRESWKAFYPYNHSALHKEHNKIRRENKINFWKNGDIETTKRRMTVCFDDYMWKEIRNSIINGVVYNRNTMLEYINTNLMEHLLEINTNKRLHKIKRISREVLEARVHGIGYKTITEYISSIKKNHKIINVEIVGGDDVYCMTVEGLNGEDDRHNFAVCGINSALGKSGCFVSNCSTDDFFIPVRDASEGNPIETLSAGNNLTAMDDIKYIQNKVFTALRVPKPFLNFEEAQAGEGKNASMLDVRFMRTVNRIQQMLLIELNKICIIHLYLLGFTDDLTNFSLTMNNPSSVAEQLEIENISKKITAAKDATADPGNGFPLMSMTRAWKEILGWSEKDIQDNLNELRLEKALATELSLTPQIIQRTGLFDDVDNIYGEPGAQYQQNQQAGGGMDGGIGGFGGGGFGGGGLGGDLGGDLGTGMDMGTDLGAGIDMGAEGEMGMDAAASENAGLAGDSGAGGGEQPLMEAWNTEFFNKMLNEQKNFDTPTFNERAQKYSKMFKNRLDEFAKETPETLYDKQRAINEEYSDLTKRLGEYIANDSNE